MLLHAKDGHTGFFIWDCEACCTIDGVRWVNDDTAQYGIWVFEFPTETFETRAVQRKKIVINMEAKTILVDPKELPEDAEDKEERQKAPVLWTYLPLPA